MISFLIMNTYHRQVGERGGTVVAVLQIGSSGVRFPMVSLEFFINIILPAAL